MPDQNHFLHGPFAPVEEELAVFGLPVTGRVPAGLSGRYSRNGPNPLGLEDPGYRFLGRALVPRPGHGARRAAGRRARVHGCQARPGQQIGDHHDR